MVEKKESCAEIVRAYDYDRYLCALYGDEEDRGHLFALYAFNAELTRIPTIVSEPMLGEIRFAWWREAIEELYAGRVRGHPVVEALASSVTKRPFEKAHFDTMIEARIQDIYTPTPPSLKAMEGYGVQTTGALFALALSCVNEEGNTAFTRPAGAASALIGALRGLAFQADVKHLPFAEDTIDEAQLYQGEMSVEIQQMAEKIATRAATLLKEAKAQARGLSRRALPVAMPLSLLERDLKILSKRNFLKPGGRGRDGSLGKQWTVLRVALKGRV